MARTAAEGGAGGMAEFSRMFADMKLPAMPDMEAVLAVQRRNMETLSAANFGYAMDSLPGQSGGPVFRYHPESKAVIFAGVHVAGDSDKNIARRYDASMRQQLKAWIAP